MPDLKTRLAQALACSEDIIDEDFALNVHPAWNAESHVRVLKMLETEYEIPVDFGNTASLSSYRPICEWVFDPVGYVEELGKIIESQNNVAMNDQYESAIHSSEAIHSDTVNAQKSEFESYKIKDDNRVAEMNRTKIFYDNAYGTDGFAAQRRYPNEELCRFMGRRFFSRPQEERSKTSILEVGCGSGANLWMLAREGFAAAGIDLSSAAIELCGEMLRLYQVSAELRAGSMLELPWPEGRFAAVVDVVSSYCLTSVEFLRFLTEARRVLEPGGHLFIYTLSKASDAWKNPGLAKRIDADTLDGVSRTDSPFAGNSYPVRFTTPNEFRAQARQAGFTVKYCETVGRTYRNGEEYFEFVVAEAVKITS
jgi:SAM-dependent methyltransferase